MNRTDLIEIDGKKYNFIPDEIGDGSECERCALKEKCHDEEIFFCNDQYGMEYSKGKRFVEIGEKAITKEKAYDDYQERTKTAGDRANDIAWCLVILLAAQLIGGKTYSNFFVACAGGLLYMLLSALQAVWQGAAIWWFKNHNDNEVLTDYPEWIGGTAWVFYHMKMAVIAASVVYITYSFLMLL